MFRKKTCKSMLKNPNHHAEVRTNRVNVLMTGQLFSRQYNREQL